MEDDKDEGCCISKIWLTREDDPFRPACNWHDSAYLEGSEASKYLTRKETDRLFFIQMLDIAGSEAKLRLKAILYYGLVRLFGGKYWDGKK